MDDPPLTYGDLIIYSKTDDINEAYIDTFNNYIDTEVVVSGKDSITVLDNFFQM